jgi:hypothetical protein
MLPSSYTSPPASLTWTTPPPASSSTTRLPALFLSLQFRLAGSPLPATVPVAGKRLKAPAVHLSLQSPSGASLLYIRDNVSAVSYLVYLVDTGAALSLLPHRSLRAPSGPTIVNANGGIIPSWNFV